MVPTAVGSTRWLVTRCLISWRCLISRSRLIRSHLIGPSRLGQPEPPWQEAAWQPEPLWQPDRLGRRRLGRRQLGRRPDLKLLIALGGPGWSPNRDGTARCILWHCDH